MTQNLQKLISLFLAKVREAEDIMKANFNIEEPMCYRQAGIARVGQIGTYSYSFHGIGCRFRFGEFNVDYDYAENGRIDGFDLWRLSRFGEQFEEFKDYISSGEIELDFKAADKSNKIVKFKQESLYHAENT